MKENQKLPEIKTLSREYMNKRIAFFSEQKGSKMGLPDSKLPECTRELINIIGFEPPKGDSKHVSPLGNDNAQMPAINISMLKCLQLIYLKGLILVFAGVNQVKGR